MTLELITTTERPPKCPLFIELCAGTAAVSLALQGGCRPPISRMGAKTGYAEPILAAVGLKPRDGAACYLWCEPDDGARAMLMSYALPELRAEAASIIRGWKDEDPRALWDRLRAEGPIRGVDGREVARWAYIRARSDNIGKYAPEHDDRPRGGWRGNGPPRTELARRISTLPPQPPTLTAPDARPIDPHTLARWLRIVTANRLINVDPDTFMNTGNGGTHHGGAEFCTPPERLADAAEQVVDEWPGVAVVADGRVVDPREVARWLQIAGMCRKGDGTYFEGWVTGLSDAAQRHLGPTTVNNYRIKFGVDERGRPCAPCRAHPDVMIPRLEAFPKNWPPTLINDDARPLHPPALPEGTVTIFDPPYQDTTKYAHDLPRDEVLTIAQRWADAGATVIICEAVPLGSVVHEGIAPAEPGPLEGWHCHEITACRKGQKRTFAGKQARDGGVGVPREWITMSRPADKTWAAGLALTNRAIRNQADAPEERETLSLFGG